MSRKWMIAICLLPAGLSGCRGLGYLGYLLSPEPVKTVEPEFGGLANRSIAVVVYADEKVLYEYPRAPMDLSMLIAEELRKNVKGANVIPPEQVGKYQAQNINWDGMDKTKLGSALKAEYVLFISLVGYSTHEPGSVNLYRGHIVAEASVYQTSLPERRARVWPNSGAPCNLEAVYPSKMPAGVVADNDAEVRYKVAKLLADKLVKKFYKHEVKEENENPSKTSEDDALGSAGRESRRLPADDRLVHGPVRPAAEGRGDL